MLLIRSLYRPWCFVVSLLLMTTAAQAAVEIRDGYVRGLPPGQPVTAAFMRLVNSGGSPVNIVAAATDSAERAEIHTHRHRDGMMSMEQVESITVPANGALRLAPGKFHLMLINLHKPLVEGDTVMIELRTDSGDAITARLPVRSVLNE